MSTGASFRKMALSLPDTTEQDHFGTPSFRVMGKIFAQLSADETRGLVKLPEPIQAWAMDAFAGACEPAPSWGKFGWTWLICKDVPQDALSDLLGTSWRTVMKVKPDGAKAKDKAKTKARVAPIVKKAKRKSAKVRRNSK